MRRHPERPRQDQRAIPLYGRNAQAAPARNLAAELANLKSALKKR